MTTVFLSGSRKISRLNDIIRNRVQNMIDKGFQIIVGDANGADKALQGYLAEKQYRNVTVFCAGEKCRNNVGSWETRKIDVDPKLKGRAFYTQKDKKMATEADYGLVLWDGKSEGSISNVLELLKRGKNVAVYLSTKKEFTSIKKTSDVETLLHSCGSDNYRAISKMSNISRHLKDLRLSSQGSLNL